MSFVGNPLGKWETGVTTNVGFDATIFKNTEIDTISNDDNSMIKNDFVYEINYQFISNKNLAIIIDTIFSIIRNFLNFYIPDISYLNIFIIFVL